MGVASFAARVRAVVASAAIVAILVGSTLAANHHHAGPDSAHTFCAACANAHGAPLPARAFSLGMALAAVSAAPDRIPAFSPPAQLAPLAFSPSTSPPDPR